MSIWFKSYTLDDILPMAQANNILRGLGIEFTAITPDSLQARMPVDERTHQPIGILHGGATCVLAETLGSVASMLVIDPDAKIAVGSVITANHLRPVRDGFVTGTCRAIHLGRTKHVWDIRVENAEGKLVAKSELTCAVSDKS